MAAVHATAYTDTLDADFALGSFSSTNGTNDSIILNESSGAYVLAGNYTSQVFDFGSNPNGTISWSATTPTNTAVLVSTRSGNSTNSSNSSAWTTWSSDYSTTTGSVLAWPRYRYLQYRVQLTSLVNTTTPTVHSVSWNVTELNSTVTASTSNANLTTNSTGNYTFGVVVNDTFTVLNVTARYSINDSSYSSSSDMTGSGTTYTLSIPQPGGNWSNYSGTNLTLEVSVLRNNGSANSTHIGVVHEVIELLNNYPVFTSINNQSFAQNQTLTLTVSAVDPENQSLTFTTNNANITVTALTNSSARLTWTAGSWDVGQRITTVYANDTHDRVSATFVSNISDVNDAPTIAAVTDITGYHGIMQPITLTATDYDSSANISFSMVPSFFTISTITNSSAPYTYYGVANFTPATPEWGDHNVTFIVSDGYDSANTTASISITYCGDAVCSETYENETSCAIDCVETAELKRISLVVPDRNCVNESMTIYTYDASDRYSCYYQGLVEQGFALCDPLESVSVEVYTRSGSLLVSADSLSSNSNGTISYTPLTAGEYKFTATKEDYANTSSIVNVRECEGDVVVQEQNFTISQPPLPLLTDRPTVNVPQEEEPGITQETASLVQIVLFYFVVPLLLAALLYMSSVFYDVNKDTLPVLLETRIFVAQQQRRFAPQLAAVGKTLKPVSDSLNALYGATLKPVVDKLKKQRK
jgi:hypothetical protein